MLHLSFLKMLIVNVLLDDLNHTSGVEYFNEKSLVFIPGKKTHLTRENTKIISGYELIYELLFWNIPQILLVIISSSKIGSLNSINFCILKIFFISE